MRVEAEVHEITLAAGGAAAATAAAAAAGRGDRAPRVLPPLPPTFNSPSPCCCSCCCGSARGATAPVAAATCRLSRRFEWPRRRATSARCSCCVCFSASGLAAAAACDSDDSAPCSVADRRGWRGVGGGFIGAVDCPCERVSTVGGGGSRGDGRPIEIESPPSSCMWCSVLLLLAPRRLPTLARCCAY